MESCVYSTKHSVWPQCSLVILLSWVLKSKHGCPISSRQPSTQLILVSDMCSPLTLVLSFTELCLPCLGGHGSDSKGLHTGESWERSH